MKFYATEKEAKRHAVKGLEIVVKTKDGYTVMTYLQYIQYWNSQAIYQ